jgi:hypothetical protein
MGAPSNWMSPLARAERMLTTRLLGLERRVAEESDPQAPVWTDYVRTVEALTRVLERLRPMPVAGLGPPPPLGRRPGKTGPAQDVGS